MAKILYVFVITQLFTNGIWIFNTFSLKKDLSILTAMIIIFSGIFISLSIIVYIYKQWDN